MQTDAPVSTMTLERAAADEKHRGELIEDRRHRLTESEITPVSQSGITLAIDFSNATIELGLCAQRKWST